MRGSSDPFEGTPGYMESEGLIWYLITSKLDARGADIESDVSSMKKNYKNQISCAAASAVPRARPVSRQIMGIGWIGRGLVKPL